MNGKCIRKKIINVEIETNQIYHKYCVPAYS